MKQVYPVVFTVIIIFILFCGLLYAIQDSMIFYHNHDQESRNFLLNRPGFEEVSFTAQNGKTYHGMIYRAIDETAPLLIYFGGNGENSYRPLYVCGL
jgi:hypothetical protein